MTSVPQPPFAAMIGLDWGNQTHDIALQVAGTDTIETSRLPHQPTAVAAWLAGLAQRFGGQPVAIALETSRGAIVHALLEAPFVVLYPVNPRSLRRFRETFSPSGAKDDGPDAQLLLRLLTKHQDHLKPLTLADSATRSLDRLVQYRRTLVELGTKLTLQLQAALKEYFPQALELVGTDLAAPMACHFLAQWPTLAAVQRVRPETVRKFYVAHNCRSEARITARLATIATATPLTRDRAIIEPTALYVQALAAQLLELSTGLTRVADQIRTEFAAHPDALLFQAIPGAGAAFAPRLLVAFGTDRARFPTAAAVQQASGIAPITIRSGKSCVVHWRWAASAFLRQTFHEFAAFSIREVEWARVFYAEHRQRGHSHHAAVRALAFKWIRILWRCWQDRTPYDDARYVLALQTRRSPLAAALHPQPV